MAGKELYIEPILDANLSVVPGLSDNIAEMTAQLNETTRILTNVLANQGLEAHQQAYNGSAFSALTLARAPYYLNTAIPAEFSLLKTGYNLCGADEVRMEGTLNKTSGVDFSAGARCYLLQSEEEYYAPANISVTIFATTGGSWKYTAKVYFWDGTSTDVLTSNTSSSEPCVISIPAEHQGKRIRSMDMNVVLTGGSATDGRLTVHTPIFDDAEGNSKQMVNHRFKYIGFNAANALSIHADAKSAYIIADVLDVVIPQTAYISLPDIVSVGTWAVFLTNGNIEGTSLALVDDTSHDLIATLPAATSDISNVVQTSNLAFSAKFTTETQVINSIAQRYY